MSKLSTKPSGINDPVSTLFRILSVVALLGASLYVLMPFFGMLLWAVVLCIALNPAQEYLEQRFRLKSGFAASLLIGLLSILLILPAGWLLFSTAESVSDYFLHHAPGSLGIPPPDERIRQWPLIGEQLYTFWLQAGSDLSGLLNRFQEPISKSLFQLAAIAGNAAADLFYFFLSLIVSGVFLAYGRKLSVFSQAALRKLSPDRVYELSDLVVTTVRSTVKGVLVVAVLQSILAGFAFVMAGIPLAGLWTGICLFLALVQIGILPVAALTCMYAWMNLDTWPALLFTAWMVFIGIVDNIIRPWLMGKDTRVPAGIVFVGSLGGLLTLGFIGLFIGAVLLSIVYAMLLDWIREPHTA